MYVYVCIYIYICVCTYTSTNPLKYGDERERVKPNKIQPLEEPDLWGEAEQVFNLLDYDDSGRSRCSLPGFI